MNCMKCLSTQNLSIKYRTKFGAKYVCRTCRNADHHALKDSKSPYLIALEREQLRRIRKMIEWDMKAWKINSKIMRKYA